MKVVKQDLLHEKQFMKILWSDADSGPLEHVLRCSVSESWDFFTFIQIGSGHTVAAWLKIYSRSQLFRYGRSKFCLPHRLNFSDSFDLCLHWVSVLSPCILRSKNMKESRTFKLEHMVSQKERHQTTFAKIFWRILCNVQLLRCNKHCFREIVEG